MNSIKPLSISKTFPIKVTSWAKEKSKTFQLKALMSKKPSKSQWTRKSSDPGVFVFIPKCSKF